MILNGFKAEPMKKKPILRGGERRTKTGELAHLVYAMYGKRAKFPKLIPYRRPVKGEKRNGFDALPRASISKKAATGSGLFCLLIS
ncbi:hypothetical protein BWI93_09990 [Siphonobacter sp. BAB-5385]|nr:hypothetical protein BWI93_09990 [Siphonobacter sp. BAB-5385]